MGFKIFERIVLFIVRMYVELSAALKIFDNFLFHLNSLKKCLRNFLTVSFCCHKPS